MCGIVGVVDPGRRRGEEETDRVLRVMAGALRDRGPDGEGTWIDEFNGVGLAHRRLSVIDLSSAGAQPMTSSDGHLVLTYNGELYNHVEFARQLGAAGKRLTGHSDSEILVEAIARWGLAHVLERADGMFAFGLWDRTAHQLTLARDRMGEKPLYYGRLATGEFVFASTLDALRLHPAFDCPVDRDALALFFRFKYVPAPWSIYEGIRKVPPGSIVRVGGRSAEDEVSRYWSYLDTIESSRQFDGDATQAVDQLERLLQESIGRRLVADVPVGAFLSGGIDSSAVVATAQQITSSPLQTFTIGSRVADFDESSDARLIANHLGTDHHELMVSDADALAVVDKLGGIWDEPFGDSSQIPTLLVSQLASARVTVALSGDGGDELFQGYNRYTWLPSIWRRIERLPRGARRMGANLGLTVPVDYWDRGARLLPARRRPRMAGVKVSKALEVAAARDLGEAFAVVSSHWKSPNELVLGANEPLTIHTTAREIATGDASSFMAFVDATTYLPDDILVKVDRATMAHGLEGRIPLLSTSIVEFAGSLPPSFLHRDGQSKWVLRELVRRSVPAHLIDRPKAGFGVPLAQWLRGPLREWAEERLVSEAVVEHLDVSLVGQVWQDHVNGRRNRAYEIWDVLMFAEWAAVRT